MRLQFGYGRQLEPVLAGRPLFTAISWRIPPRPRIPRSSFAVTSTWRGAKTKSATKLKELAQGALESKESYPPLVDDAPQYPTVIQGVRKNMTKFKNCVLLTRVGNFYEVSRPLSYWRHKYPTCELMASGSCTLNKLKTMRLC